MPGIVRLYIYTNAPQKPLYHKELSDLEEIHKVSKRGDIDSMKKAKLAARTASSCACCAYEFEEVEAYQGDKDGGWHF